MNYGRPALPRSSPFGFVFVGKHTYPYLVAAERERQSPSLDAGSRRRNANIFPALITQICTSMLETR